MVNDNTIFDLQQSRTTSEFIVKNADLVMESFADIVETLKDIPYLGSLIKLGKVTMSFIDYRFFCKLGHFLKVANEVSGEELTRFFASLSYKDKKRISDYLTQLLYTAEDASKAELMGKIYKRRVLGDIDNDMMLRLCSIVNRAYITDLDYLEEYLTVSETNTYVTDNLVALGVLADVGNIYEENTDEWESTGFGPTKHTLNEVGKMLYQILTDKPIDIGIILRLNKNEVQFRSMATSEIDEILSDLRM